MTSWRQWLKTLKPGDTVCYHSKYYGTKIVTVTSITEKGYINTSDGNKFRNGHAKRDGSQLDKDLRLMPVRGDKK